MINNYFFGIIAQDMYSNTLKDVGKKIEDVSKEHKKATSKMKEDTKKVIDENKKLESSFSRLTSKVKYFIAGYLGISTLKKGFTDNAYFDKYIQKIGIITHTTGKELNFLSREMKLLSMETGAELRQLGEAGTILASGGVHVKDMKEYLKAIMDVKMASREELNESNIAGMMNVMKMNFPDKKASEMADNIVWMLDKVKGITFEDLSNSLGRSAPLAKQMGVDLKELLAIESGDILNIGGLRASFGMADFLAMLDGQQEKISKALQLDSIDLKKQGGLVKFLNDIEIKFRKVGREGRLIELKKVFGDNETSRRINAYIDNLQEVNKLYGNLENNAKGFAEKAGIAMKFSDYMQMKQINANLDASFVNLGKTLSNLAIPQMVKNITKAIEELTNKMSELSSEGKFTKKSILGLGIGGVLGYKATKSGLKNIFSKEIRKDVIKVSPYGKIAKIGLTAGLIAFDPLYEQYKKVKEKRKLNKKNALDYFEKNKDNKDNILNKITMEPQKIEISITNNADRNLIFDAKVDNKNNNDLSITKRNVLNR